MKPCLKNNLNPKLVNDVKDKQWKNCNEPNEKRALTFYNSISYINLCKKKYRKHKDNLTTSYHRANPETLMESVMNMSKKAMLKKLIQTTSRNRKGTVMFNLPPSLVDSIKNKKHEDCLRGIERRACWFYRLISKVIENNKRFIFENRNKIHYMPPYTNGTTTRPVWKRTIL